MLLQHIGSKFTARVMVDANKFLVIVIENTHEFVKSHTFPLIERRLVFFRMEGCSPIHVLSPPATDLSLSGTAREEECQEVDTTQFQHLIGCLLHLSNTTHPEIHMRRGTYLIL